MGREERQRWGWRGEEGRREVIKRGKRTGGKERGGCRASVFASLLPDKLPIVTPLVAGRRMLASEVKVESCEH